MADHRNTVLPSSHKTLNNLCALETKRLKYKLLS